MYPVLPEYTHLLSIGRDDAHQFLILLHNLFLLQFPRMQHRGILSLWDSLIPYLGEPQKSGLIIHDEGNPLSERQYSNRWNAIQKKLKEAGLKESFTAHQLRHTYATIAANSGDIPIKVLQGLMGHANFHTTMNTYASLDVDQMLTTRSIISDKYAEISGKSCS